MWIKFEHLCEQCAQPNVTESEAGGVPFMKGATLPISRILERLYVHGSIPAVVGYYGDITEEQIKDAILHAQTLMENQQE